MQPDTNVPQVTRRRGPSMGDPLNLDTSLQLDQRSLKNGGRLSMCPLYETLSRALTERFLSLSEDLLFLCCLQENRSQTFSGTPVFQPAMSHWPLKPPSQSPFFSFHHRLQPPPPPAFRLTLSNQNPPKLEPPELSPGWL